MNNSEISFNSYKGTIVIDVSNVSEIFNKLASIPIKEQLLSS